MQLSLRAALKKKRRTPAQLAADAGLNKTTVYRLLNGSRRPSYDTVEALEDALGLSRGTLTFRDKRLA